MANLIVDERDQKFVLYEMLGVISFARRLHTRTSLPTCLT